MIVLITGGLGYIGGRLGQYLARTGATVRLGTRRSTAPPRWLTGASVVPTDWHSSTALQESCSGVDAVIHVAGANARDCLADPVAALEANGVATARLVQAAVRQKVTRFIYISTAHVYGSPLTGVITEDTCPAGLHPYATSHRAGEEVVRDASGRGEIEGLVIRLSNAFGPPAHADVDCWVLLCNDLCRQAVTTGRMVLSTPGLQRRDFITLTDTCRAIHYLLALPASKAGNGVFNLGGNWSPTVLELAGTLRAAASAVLRTEVELSAPATPPAAAPQPLRFGIDKLAGTGFVLTRDHSSEINQLLEFCKSAFSASPLPPGPRA